MRERRSSATWLLLAWLLLIVYASLYPFEPWRWPPGQEWPSLLALPWPRKLIPFDVNSNLAGYAPLGFLSFAAMLRSGRSLRSALWLALLIGPLLSFGMEVLQNFLPERVPSRSDWLFNTMGSTAGVLVGLALDALGVLSRWQDWRDDWFEPHSAGALALLALWPMALLFPAPVPLGLGQWLPHLQDWAADLLEGTAWLQGWFDADEPVLRALPPGFEAIATALGLLGPALLALVIARRGWQRVLLVAGAAGVGVAVSALSTALNFGPQHAWAWISPPTLPGLLLGGVLGLLAVPLPRRVNAALGLLVLSSLIALVTHAPADPYLSLSLRAWEQGRFINLYGLAQWLGWVWPFAALVWLLGLAGRRNL